MSPGVEIVSCEELEHEDPEGPVVGGDVMALVEDDFGSHVLWSATECPRLSSNLERVFYRRCRLELKKLQSIELFPTEMS